MVDHLGKQERGCIPGTEKPEMFVKCIHVNGGEITLEEAARTYYYAPVCAPIGHSSSPCPDQKSCLALRLHEQQAEVLRAEQQKQGNQRRSTVFGEAFRNLHRW